MDPRLVRELLERVQGSEISVDDALEALRQLPFRDIGVATVDHHRALRQGVPEVIFGERKTVEQIARIAEEMVRAGHNVLVTRVDADKAGGAPRALFPGFRHAREARTLSLESRPCRGGRAGPVAVVTAGTSDIAVAEEAVETLSAVGLEAAARCTTWASRASTGCCTGSTELRRAAAVIVVRGDGGRAAERRRRRRRRRRSSRCPPRSGTARALGGFTALFAMLTSCASGVVVVNIDSGFGAAMAVHRILKD